MKDSTNSKASVWELRQPQLGRMLKNFRLMHDETKRVVAQRLSEQLEDHKNEPEWQEFCGLVYLKEGKVSVTKLESPSLVEEVIKIPSLEPLEKAYKVPQLMFNTLLSIPVKGFYRAFRGLNDFKQIQGKGDSLCRYCIPEKVLRGVDNILPIYLILKPGGETPDHQHSGDEILYVEKGMVEVYMKNTGLRITLKEDDFIHFDAGQLHGAENNSGEEAKILIIRFLTLPSGPRLDIYKEALSKKPSPKVVQRIIEEMRISAWPPEGSETEEPKEVQDRCGLGHFLQLSCLGHILDRDRYILERSKKTRTFDDLLKKAQYLNKQPGKEVINYSRSRLVRLHNGDTNVKTEELPRIAEIHEIHPVLLYNFLSAAYQYIIGVCKEKPSWRTVPSEFDICKGVQYKVPRQRLAFSDVSIALVELEEGTSVPENQHQGYEFLKVLEGEVTVELENFQYPPIKKDECAYYLSYISHKVHNSGTGYATVLAFRFFNA
jgi:quercetin dioxygenase-like cupin family protein